MKKLILFVMVMAMADICFAQQSSHYVYDYTIKNDSPKAHSRSIATSSIRPGVDKIVGYKVVPLNGDSKETYLTIYDNFQTNDGSAINLYGEILGEAENVAGYPDGEFFTFPKRIETGVMTEQGSFTSATIYFIKE